jgi:hypothetical protein
MGIDLRDVWSIYLSIGKACASFQFSAAPMQMRWVLYMKLRIEYNSGGFRRKPPPIFPNYSGELIFCLKLFRKTLAIVFVQKNIIREYAFGTVELHFLAKLGMPNVIKMLP